MSLPFLSIRTQDSRLSTHSASNRVSRQRGFVMIEMMLAVGIVGTAMFAVVTAFSTVSKNAEFIDGAATAQWVATSQIELVRAATFVFTPGTYTAVTVPTGYAVSNTTAAVTGGDANIQIVTVIVTKAGETVFEASTTKVNR
jgi:prepilin-type N-terminal cleavage/methylation domain-containing protein